MIRSFRRHLLDRFVLRPSRNPLAYAPKERCVLAADDLTDEYFVQHSVHQDSHHVELFVIKFPGTAGRAERSTDWPAAFLPDTPIKICTWNAPGYGASSGRATLANIASRALRFYNHVTGELAGRRPKIWLVGNSLGCATATYLASRTDVQVDGLILRNPPPLIQTVKRVARQYPLGRLTDAIAESLPVEMNLSLTAPRTNVPTVMLQSERDELVPPEFQMEIFDSLGGPKRLVVLKGLMHDGVATDVHHCEIAAAIDWLWSGQHAQGRSAAPLQAGH